MEQYSLTEVPEEPVTLLDNVQEILNAFLEKCKCCFAINHSELGNISIEMEIRLNNKEIHEMELVRKIVDDLLRNKVSHFLLA